jgi:hypothetical protein
MDGKTAHCAFGLGFLIAGLVYALWSPTPTPTHRRRFSEQTSDQPLHSITSGPFEASVLERFPSCDKPATQGYLRAGNALLISPPLSIQSALESNPLASLSTKKNLHHNNHNAVHPCPRCPPGFRSAASSQLRSNRWSLTGLVVLAAASTLASPIPAEPFSKKEVAVARLDVLAREPETVEARDPVCVPNACY